MKYIVLLLDGSADTPILELNKKTPLEAAQKPNIDSLAQKSIMGKIKTVPDGFSPGSDVANLSVMGFNPEECYTGRSPLEAASIGIDLKNADICLRCNLVTLSNEESFEQKTMVDYCGGDIHTKDADVLISFINEKLGNERFKFYTGTAYRHCLVTDTIKNTGLGLTPPHDISGKKIGEYLSKNKEATELITLMKKSYELLNNHPLNIERIKNGLKPANSIWFWGEGTKPNIENFYKKWGINGGVVSAVDLIKGIAKCSGMQVAEVEGATGYIDSNFKGKVNAAKELLKTCDYVYLHMEAPDECGHRGEIENKVKSIEIIDKEVVGPILDYLKGTDYRILIMPDHPTPLNTMTHSREPVPFLLYDSCKVKKGENSFTEKLAEKSNIFIKDGYKIADFLFEKEKF